MVPILAGMLSRSSEPLSAIRGFALSTTYAVAMALAYAVLGVVAAWSGQNLQIALQSPYALGFMAAIYVVLALSSFGLFELRMPAFTSNGATHAPRSAIGSFVGAAMLGFTSALIVGPCVTPPLAAALLYVGQTGDVVRGAAALFALGLGMGLPLILVGTFGSGILPRSGAWLLASRRLFGVLFLGVAALLIGRIVPPAISLAIWAALLIGAGVFLGHSIRCDSGRMRLSASKRRAAFWLSSTARPSWSVLPPVRTILCARSYSRTVGRSIGTSCR
jgi:Thiol:disulfide interchange protein